MSTEKVFADEALEALRKKFFPRVPWTAAAGGGAACLEAFRRRGEADMMVFGQGLDVYWCDFAFGLVDDDGWQEVLVRSEEAENLTALAHAVGAVRFKKA